MVEAYISTMGGHFYFSFSGDILWQQYNKLIQCYSLIQCNTCQYNIAFPYTLYHSHNQIIFLQVKHTVFRTILGLFSTEWKS